MHWRNFSLRTRIMISYVLILVVPLTLTFFLLIRVVALNSAIAGLNARVVRDVSAATTLTNHLIAAQQSVDHHLQQPHPAALETARADLDALTMNIEQARTILTSAAHQQRMTDFTAQAATYRQAFEALNILLSDQNALRTNLGRQIFQSSDILNDILVDYALDEKAIPRTLTELADAQSSLQLANLRITEMLIDPGTTQADLESQYTRIQAELTNAVIILNKHSHSSPRVASSLQEALDESRQAAVTTGKLVENIRQIREQRETRLNQPARALRQQAEAIGQNALASLTRTTVDLEQQVIQMEQLTGFFLFLTVLGAVLIAIQLARTIARPIKSLVAATSQINQGNYDVQVAQEDGGEVGQLLRAFNQMAADLKHEQAKVLRQQQALADQNVALQQALQELSRAKQTAEEANRHKSQFLANMSHELRSPLSAILGFSDLMQREALVGRQSLTSAQQEHLSLIHRSGEHLLTLINNVLDLSKIEAGHIILHETDFDLYQLLADLEDMFSLKARDKHLSLQFEREPNLPQFVHMDGVKLRQVLINLLNNAIKFTKEGGVIMRVGLLTPNHPQKEESNFSLPVERMREEPPTYLHFAVADTGPGLAPEEMERLFEAFTQTTAGQASREGTGLGLTISRQFVQRLGGNLSVHSQVGQGSLFQFDIPVRVIETTQIKAKVPARRVIGLAPNQPHYRILIADDNETNRYLLLSLLQPLGFELKEAANGQEAIEVWQQWQPHLIWMDMRMPVLDGYKTTKRIKATLQGQQTKILALTASSFEDERVTVLAAGCDDFLRKPFREVQLLELMGQHLGLSYVYEEMETVPETALYDQIDTQTLVSQIAGLPTELLARIETAAIRARMAEVNGLIEEIRSQDASVAEILHTLADQFEYPRIVGFIQAASQRVFQGSGQN